MNVRGWAALAAFALVACEPGAKKEDPREDDAPAQPARTVAPTPTPAPPKPTLATAQTLPEALTFADFDDMSEQRDGGAQVFALWATQRMFWADLQAMKPTMTKHALVMKDPETERKKLYCTSGTIIQIEVTRELANQPIAIGGLIMSNGNVVTFMAVRSTGEIVQRSHAGICGIVTGTFTYSNSGGGTTHSLHIVGMFDLPENRAVTPPASAVPAGSGTLIDLTH